ncbi:hypothetical protein ACNJX9_34735 [Bradyrhizobium sp. DASA03076]|uniref:hypothetical protein n=1 Tax=Bradyrhizobium sp. BLXBL-03 TaxID=3395916 RepID=UPI003F72C00B
MGRQNWAATWTKIGNDHCLLGDVHINKGSFDEAAEACLCALTAFEVARRLVDEDDPQNKALSTKIDAEIHKFGSSLQQKIECARIACCDQIEFRAYHVPAASPDTCAPAVICISREDETGAALLGRLLPAVIGRGMSILVIAHDDVSNHPCGHSNLLSCCLDYLSIRHGGDASRIGIYGEGLSAVFATDFAASDRRVTAAVCDGGLWNWARALASVRWLTKNIDGLDSNLLTARRSRYVRQLRCPVLVVAGGRGIVSVSEAIKLKAECMAPLLDLELTIARTSQTPIGEIEDFVSSDDRIFGWLQHKLAKLELHSNCWPRQK